MSEALRNGTTIGGLRVNRVLGAGGFGITYLATDLKSGNYYALKEYYPADLASRSPRDDVEVQRKDQKLFDTGLDAFYSEANLLRALPRRDGLMAVRGLFKKHGTAYVVMELIDGKPLTSLIKSYQRNDRFFAEGLVREFLTSVGGALSLVHSAGLIHRDIKPDNIMVRRSDGQPILIDFGAARELSGREKNAAMYTPSFAAIEQIPKQAGGPPKVLEEGPWTDVFSVCVVAYYMMCGEKPPTALTRFKQLESGLGDPYVSIRDRTEGRYTGILCDLVDAGCRLDPESRPGDAAAFFGQIAPKGVLPPIPPKADSTFGQRDIGQSVHKTRRTTPKMVIWTLIIGVVSLIAYIILVYTNSV